MTRKVGLPGRLPDSCPCDVNTCRTNLTRRRLSVLRPQAAVTEAARERPTSHFLYMLSLEVRNDPRYRRAGAAQMFIDHMLNASPGTVDSARHWEFPAIGIINIMAGIQNDQSQEQDAAIMRCIYSFCDQLIVVLHKEIPSMIQGDEESERRRYIASQIVSCFLQDKEMLK